MSRRHLSNVATSSIRLLPLVLLLMLHWGAPASAFEVTAIQDNALSLTGIRPPSNPGDLDQSGYVRVPYSTSLNPSSGSLSIEAWVKRNATSRNETLVGNGWHASYWFGFGSNGSLRFYSRGFGSHGEDSVGRVSAGAWTHVAVTYDGFTRRFYINGVLDTTSTATPGPIGPAPAGQPLGIGFDRDDFTNVNYFGGLLDNVRIWNTVRSPTQIKVGMFQTYGTSPLATGLRAEWRFNGNANDAAGTHNGSLRGYGVFVNDGALPRNIRIPQVSATPSLNGSCSTGEYANAAQVSVDGTKVWLQHTATDLWICFEDLGNADNAQVYLDARLTRVDPAQPEHLALRVGDDGTISASVGTGNGGYTPTGSANGLWDGKYARCCGEFPSANAEFRIAATLVDGWEHVIGLALGRFYVRAGGDMWPALGVNTLPSTWSLATLGGIGDPRTFAGKVVYQPRDENAPALGIADVTVDLIGSDPGGSEALVATTSSNLFGGFSLTTNDDYTRHRIEMGAPP